MGFLRNVWEYLGTQMMMLLLFQVRQMLLIFSLMPAGLSVGEAWCSMAGWCAYAPKSSRANKLATAAPGSQKSCDPIFEPEANAQNGLESECPRVTCLRSSNVPTVD